MKHVNLLARGACLLFLSAALAACSSSVSPSAPLQTGTTRELTLHGKTITAEVVGDRLLFEGDIDLGSVTDFDAGRLEPQSIYHDSPNNYRWKAGVVPFVFDSNVTANDRTVLNAAMNHWTNAVPALRFVARTTQGDYVRFKRHSKYTDRCSSHVGRQGGEQTIYLMKTGPCSTFSMVHELGHALGLWHEQSRQDRDSFVTINWTNIRTDLKHNFEKHVSDGLDIGAYDYDSLMHYPRDAFCLRNAQGNCVGDTIVPKNPNAQIGQRNHLSNGDVASIRWIYLRDWLVSDGGVNIWRNYGISNFKTGSLALGDFNGDGRTDIFRADPSACVWYVSYAQGNPGQAGAWQTLSTGKCESLSVLRFGDFDGDRKTDVFVTSGGVWYISSGGVAWWSELNGSSSPLSDLAFGDFDGDGTTDVFRGNGRSWYVSYGGATFWQEINTSGFEVPELRFADFDGNGTTDVFRATGSEWLVSYGGVSAWQHLNSSSYSSGLRFGHFNGDRAADIYRQDGSTWQISYGGTGLWTPLPSNLKLPPYTAISGFLFGDFDGNGLKDVFAAVK